MLARLKTLPWKKIGWIGGIGTAASLILYGLIRRISPEGTPLILYANAGSSAGEFRTVAQRIVSWTPHARAVAISSANDVYREIANHQGKINVLCLVGHGTSRAFFSNLTSVDPASLARAMAGKLTSDGVIGLVGCRAAADPSEADWTAQSFGPGGAASFAGRLRDALVSSGAPWGSEVRAHSTSGHASRNPAVRVFRCTRSSVGRPGLAFIDILFGSGAWEQGKLRSRWTEAFRGYYAERVISGAGVNQIRL